MQVQTSRGEKLALLKSEDYKQLQNLKSNMDDASGKVQDIGRPLFVRVHDHFASSMLSASSKTVEFRGMINLLTLLLVSYNLQSVLQSIEEHGFILSNTLNKFYNAFDQLYDIRNL